MADALAIAVDLIGKRGSMRTPELAAELGIGEAAVDAMLLPARLDGRLNTCDVLTGERRSIEYRSSVNGGSYSPHMGIAPLRRARPFVPPLTTREEPQVTFKERMEKFFSEHGAMTVLQMRAHGVKDAGLSTLLGQAGFARLGGGKRSTVWGLDGQKAPKPDALEAGAELGRKAEKPAKKKSAGGGVRCSAA